MGKVEDMVLKYETNKKDLSAQSELTQYNIVVSQINELLPSLSALIIKKVTKSGPDVPPFGYIWVCVNGEETVAWGIHISSYERDIDFMLYITSNGDFLIKEQVSEGIRYVVVNLELAQSEDLEVGFGCYSPYRSNKQSDILTLILNELNSFCHTLEVHLK